MADTTFDFGIIAGGTGPLRELKAGDVIFKQGDAGQELFIIKSGKVEIRIGNRVLDTLSPGNIFGEMALINSAPRNATAVAITDATLIAVSEKQFMFSISTLALNIMRDMSRRLRKRAQETELMNIEAITASIVNEIKQPLTAVAATPVRREYFLEKLRQIFKRYGCLIPIVDGVHRTSDVLDAIRSLFQGTNQSRDQIDLNEIILEILEPMGAELKNHGITTLPQLTTNIPRFYGNRRQLQEVIVNLLRNAIEAMDITTDRNRVLRLKTERRGVDAIVPYCMENSGLGIDQKNLESIFDAFVTTKRHGMGLGLAICRVIVNQHGGQLTASSNGKDGALFQVMLPVGSGAPRRSPGVIAALHSALLRQAWQSAAALRPWLADAVRAWGGCSVCEPAALSHGK